MGALTEAVETARAAVNAVASEVLTDVCSFTRPGAEARNAYDETTTPDNPAIANVPCGYKALTAIEKLSGGRVTAVATHKLKLPANADTLVIDENYKGTIAARTAIVEEVEVETVPAMKFEVTGRLDSSLDAFLYLAITLKGSGE